MNNAKQLGLRVVDENNLPMEREANRDIEVRKLMPPPEWLQREMNVAHIVVALKQIKDALWFVGLMLGFLVVIGFFMWAK